MSMLKNKTKVIYIFLGVIIGFLCQAPSILTAQTNAGYAGSYLRLGLGARAIGAANTVPVGNADAYGYVYNPAALPKVERKNLGLTYGFLPLDRVYNYAGFTMPLPPTAGIGIGWLATGVNDIQGRNSSGEKTNMYTTRQNTFLLGFANKFSKYVRAGILLKLMQNNLDEIKSNTVGLDLGVVIEPIPFIEIGLSAQNFNGKFSWDAKDVYSQGNTVVNEVPTLYRIGGRFHATAKIDLMTEYERSDKGAVVYRFATEWHPLDMASLRAGVSDGHFSFGGGLRYDLFQSVDTALDYAFVTGQVGEGSAHYFSWSFQF